MGDLHPTSNEWKQKVGTSFSKHSPCYERHAVVQKQIAEFFVKEVARFITTPRHIIEVGVGTGFLTRRLLALFPEAYLTAVDLSSEMLHQVADSLSLSEQKRIHLRLEDMDRMRISPCSLLCSSFSLQWSENPLAFLSSNHLFLEKNGLIAHAFPLEGSLRSLAASGYLCPIPQLSLSMKEILASLETFDILSSEVVEKHEEFVSPLHALRHIQSFGGAVSTGACRSLFSLRGKQEPVVCEWRVGCVIARRKG